MIDKDFDAGRETGKISDGTHVLEAEFTPRMFPWLGVTEEQSGWWEVVSRREAALKKRRRR